MRNSTVVAFPARPSVYPLPRFEIATALARLGIVRIAPSRIAGGAVSFGHGRFVAVSAECPNPSRMLLVEAARLLEPHAPTALSVEGCPDRSRLAAELVADVVVSLDRAAPPSTDLLSRLEALGAPARITTLRLANRIHEAGLRPHTGPSTDASNGGRRRPLRGKPGHRSSRAA